MYLTTYHPSDSVALTAICSKATIQLLLIHCMLLIPVLCVCFVFGHCFKFVMKLLMTFVLCNYRTETDRGGCFNSIVFLL